MNLPFHFAVFVALFASWTVCAPLVGRQDAAVVITDVDVLQFALTLEHLENVFYKGALTRFPESAFLEAGFTSQYYNDLKFVAKDEEDHVVFLQGAISQAGATPVEACNYIFPFTDVPSFVALSSVLEGVGVSAYLGGAPVISSKDILTAAAAILVAEGMHQSVQRGGLQEVIAPNPVGTSIGPNGIITLASAFILSCPSTNAPLPFKAFPTLTLGQANPVSASNVVILIVAPGTTMPDVIFVTFVSGLTTISVEGTMDNGAVSATIPAEAQGQSYAFITNSAANGTLADSSVLAGPAIMEVTPAAPTIDLAILKN